MLAFAKPERGYSLFGKSQVGELEKNAQAQECAGAHQVAHFRARLFTHITGYVAVIAMYPGILYMCLGSLHIKVAPQLVGGRPLRYCDLCRRVGK